MYIYHIKYILNINKLFVLFEKYRSILKLLETCFNKIMRILYIFGCCFDFKYQSEDILVKRTINSIKSLLIRRLKIIL